MSGGVDSSVATARLVAAGHEVLGVHLSLKGEFAGVRVDASQKGCGSPTDAEDAARVASRLGIDFEVWDLADDFHSSVIAPFLDGYARGETPNPCLRCNSTIKFGALQARAIERGFDLVATGHYARLEHDPLVLRRSVDTAKDQSYVMAVLGPEQLSRVLFPLGDVVSKAVVRAEADALELAHIASKPDSTDICFIPDGDTAGFLRRHLGSSEGEVVDEAGTVLARHDGTHQFTIGQRRGLHIKLPPEDGSRRFVLDLQPATRRVVVGPEELLLTSTARLSAMNWLVPAAETEVEVQTSAHGRTTPACLIPVGDAALVQLHERIRRPAAGQQLVAYVGDRVVAAGTATNDKS